VGRALHFSKTSPLSETRNAIKRPFCNLCELIQGN
jgi:hypothetical protein